MFRIFIPAIAGLTGILLLSFTSMMAQPKITSFTPASGPAGTSISISGSGFDADPANDVVYFGAVKGTVTNASATSLQVTVPLGSTYKPLSVLNVTTGLSGTATNGFVATYTNSIQGISSAFYQPKVDLTVDLGNLQPQVADVDGDGKPDLVSGSATTGVITILRNISAPGSVGAGSFEAPITVSTGASMSNFVIMDMDGDGKPDLVVNRFNVITIFRNLASPGSFSATSFAAGQDIVSSSSSRIAVGDADGDGRNDLVYTRADPYNARILVKRNISSKGFPLSFDTEVEVGRTGNPVIDEVVMADLTGDGKPEILSLYSVRGVLSIWNNRSTPGSITTSSFTGGFGVSGGGTYLTNFTIGDLNGDGRPDLVLSGSSSGFLSVFIATANSFASPVTVSVSPYFPSGLAIGDLDGDSRPDIALGYSSTNYVTVFRNLSTSTDFNASSLAAGLNFTVAQNTTSLVISDLDLDGAPEITTFATGSANSTISILKTAMLVHARINSINPASAPAGATVTITGTGFNTTASANTVFFGAVKATVKSASDTSLTVTVPVSATYGPVTVLNNSSALSASSSQFFTPLFTTPAAAGVNSEFYKPKLDVPFYSSGYALAIGDLDADGKPDVVTADASSGNISFIRNSSVAGQTSFGTRFSYPIGTNPVAVLIKDLDGDGRPDVVTTNNGSGSISVSRNDAIVSLQAGVFFRHVDFQVGSTAFPYSTAAGDINGDGKPDLVVANHASGTLSIFANQSNPGSITAASFAAKVDFPTSGMPRAVTMGDVDGDGKTDIVYVSEENKTVTVLRNIAASQVISNSGSTATFATPVDFSTGDNPTSVALGDVDGDGKLDILVGNYAAGTVSVFRNQSAAGVMNAASFAAKTDFSIGSQPFSIGVGDADGDGKPDVVAANAGSNTLTLLRNMATSGVINTGSFASPLAFAAGGYPVSAAIADLDIDGIAEAVSLNAADSSFSVFRITPSFNAGQALIVSSLSPSSGPAGTPITITGTGFNTSAMANTVYFGSVKATVTDGGATSLTVIVPAGAVYQPVTVLNTTNALAGTSAGAYNTTFGNPFGTGTPANFYLAPVGFATGSLPYQVAAGDLDGDGKVDLAVANYNSNTVSVLRNISSTGSINAASFAEKVDFQLGNNPSSVSIADIDGDGKPDLVATCNNSSVVAVLRNTSVSGSISASSFALRMNFSTGSFAYPYHTVIADVDGDGKPDLITANTLANTVAIQRNNSGAGIISFVPTVSFAVGANPRFLATADVDGDGKLDIITANQNQNTVSVLRNTSMPNEINAASFAAPISFATGAEPYAVAAGDMDGDGKPEIVVANHGANTVSVLRNTANAGIINATSFANSIEFGTGAEPFSVTIGDADGDGKPDILTPNASSSTVTVLRNLTVGAGINASSFTPANFATGGYPLSIAFADLDGDGAGEVVTSNGANTVTVLKISMPPQVNRNATQAGQNIAAGSETLDNQIRLYPNPSSGAFMLQFQHPKAPIVIEVLNDAGKPLQRRSVNADLNTPSLTIAMNMTDQPSGIYYVKVTGVDGVQITKIILQR